MEIEEGLDGGREWKLMSPASRPKVVLPTTRAKLDQAARDFDFLMRPADWVPRTPTELIRAVPLHILRRLISDAGVYYRGLEGFFLDHDEDPLLLHSAIDVAKVQLIGDFALLRRIIDLEPRPINVMDAVREDIEHQQAFDREVVPIVTSLTKLNAEISDWTGWDVT
jgi:hypothetical protein